MLQSDCCWPDSVTPLKTVLDDVSQFNATVVNSLFQVRTKEDIQHALMQAKALGVKVSMRGTKHSMGGHTLNENGIIIDMQYINHIDYDPETPDTVTVGSGALWSDVIAYLNAFGKAPRTLQSYSSFSVGGTLSVNGHGITTDFCLVESVQGFDLITGDGESIHCSRESEDPKARELFSACIGGYGLFGVIYQVQLKVNNNVKLSMDTMIVSLKQFPTIYESILESDEVQMKLCRIDLASFEHVEIFVFKSDNPDIPTVSSLPVKPREMSGMSRLIYKWLAVPMKEARFAIERQTGNAMDWSEVNDRNSMLYESAVPLARLYDPLILVDDTFILQEYFVPKSRFFEFVTDSLSVIAKEIQYEEVINLLNITIRFVQQDKDTMLPYATSPEGMYAFVLYYRVRKTKEADQVLMKYHQKLATIVLEQKGTFYLPYRHHYNHQQLLAAYPGFPKFCETKWKYDPAGLFTNLWWERYSNCNQPSEMLVPEAMPFRLHFSSGSSLPPELYQASSEFPKADIRRKNCLRDLFANPKLKHQFVYGFLVDVFALIPHEELNRILVTVIWDKTLKTDEDIYGAIVEAVNKRNSSFLTQGKLLVTLTNQISSQKTELLRETLSVLSRLGRLGKIHDYCSIGDHGKLNLCLKNALQMKGNSWIVHDVNAKDSDVFAVLERGAVQGRDVGQYVSIDYENLRWDGKDMSEIPECSVDLVTMNQGLHHLPPSKIMYFLMAVYRILRPGGLFITREHDATPELMPMLDCAHMVFNAVTGVSSKLEHEEKRAFRPVVQWRQIIESAGFFDSHVYEMQPYDPTVDIMMCFIKDSDPRLVPPLKSGKGKEEMDEGSSSGSSSLFKPAGINSCSVQTSEKMKSLRDWYKQGLNMVPPLVLEVAKKIFNWLMENLPNVSGNFLDMYNSLVPDIPGKSGLGKSLDVMLQSYVDSAFNSVFRFKQLLETAKPMKLHGSELIADEFFLIIPALRAKAAKGGMVEGFIVGLVDSVWIPIQNAIANMAQKQGEKAKEQPHNNGSSSGDDVGFSKEELDTDLDELFLAIPELTDVDLIIDGLGISKSAGGWIKSYVNSPSFVGPDGSVDVKENVRKFMWEKLPLETVEQIKPLLQRLKNEQQLPTLKLLLERGSAWNRLAMIVLGRPEVEISRVQSFLASSVGLGNFVELWVMAQNERKTKENLALRITKKRVRSEMHSLDELCRIESVEYQCGNSLPSPVPTGVLEVLKADYTVNSLTGLFGASTRDVTAEVAKFLDPTSGVLHLDLFEPEHKPTWRAGSQKLRVEYRCLPDVTTMNSDSLSRATEAVYKQLVDEHLVDTEFRKGSSSYNWFKLCEWMEVEMVQKLSNALEHTPWYRFPFVELIQIYFGTLMKEFQVVAEKQGWQEVIFGNLAFISNVIPGLVMAMLFGEMFALAQPLLKILGDEYEEASMVEHMIIVASPHVDWDEVDSRLTSANCQLLTTGVWNIKIPTFKAMTEILIAVAKQLPSAIICRISNQNEIQMKVQISPNNHKHVSLLKNKLPGCRYNFDFQYPDIGNRQDELLQISLAVQIPYLLSTIRTCLRQKIEIVQVYDFQC